MREHRAELAAISRGYGSDPTPNATHLQSLVASIAASLLRRAAASPSSLSTLLISGGDVWLAAYRSLAASSPSIDNSSQLNSGRAFVRAVAAGGVSLEVGVAGRSANVLLPAKTMQLLSTCAMEGTRGIDENASSSSSEGTHLIITNPGLTHTYALIFSLSRAEREQA